MKRVLVSLVKENGDEFSVSVRVEDGSFTTSDKERLKSEVTKKLLRHTSELLYFKVRYNEKVGKSKGITESIKASSITSLYLEIDRMFSKLGIEDE